MDCERYLWVYLGEQRGIGESILILPIDPLADLGQDRGEAWLRSCSFQSGAPPAVRGTW
jgi:hypothetical protein